MAGTYSKKQITTTKKKTTVITLSKTTPTKKCANCGGDGVVKTRTITIKPKQKKK